MMVPPLDTITPHIAVAAENGRYRVLARREFGPNRVRSLPPFSGELTWDGTRWWVWRADA